MNNDTTYLKMFSNCIPVLGEKHSIIYDLQRSKAVDIPNDMYNFIQLFKKYSITELFKFCGEDNSEAVKEYIQFLLQQELAFYIDKEELTLFPALSMEWKWPSKISNAIIEIGETTYANFDKIIANILTLGCEHLYIKITISNAFEVINELLKKLAHSSIFSIVFEATYSNHEKIKDYETLAENEKRVQSIFLLSDLELQTESRKIIITTPENFTDNKMVFFNVNLRLFTESKNYNNYFNNKIFIDKKGAIFNAPETTENFGNITDISLKELEKIVDSETFQQYWKIHKDLLEECNDCALRYMCVDNRVPEKTKEGAYIFATKCDVKL